MQLNKAKSQLKGLKGNVVFVTAYDHYAVEAFRFSAIDYLLKPIDSEELHNALEKVKNNLANNHLQLKFNTLLENIGQTEKKKIILKEIDTHHIVEVDQVLWCSAEGSYTRVVICCGAASILELVSVMFRILFESRGSQATSQSGSR